jgi:hypothetical protein
VEGKFKSFHNVSDNVAGLMTKTSFSLLPLADLTVAVGPIPRPSFGDNVHIEIPTESVNGTTPAGFLSNAGLHYNIQIHLPPTKDIEVYNAIFKSLKEHLFE